MNLDLFGMYSSNFTLPVFCFISSASESWSFEWETNIGWGEKLVVDPLEIFIWVSFLLL